MTFLLGNAPIPITDPIARARRRDQFGRGQVDPLEGTMSDPWVDYISRLVMTVQAAATRISSDSRIDQQASISATDISGGALKAGLYRVTYYTRVTTPATVSSSLQITISWTDGGVAQSAVGKSLTGNTTTTLETLTYLIHVDASTPIRFAAAYGSVGAQPMLYRLDVVLEVILA